MAALFKVSTRTVERFRAAGEIPPPIRVGANSRWRLVDFQERLAPPGLRLPPPPLSMASLVTKLGLAALLGIHVRTLDKLRAAAAASEPIRLGAINRWRRGSIETWIEEGCPRGDFNPHVWSESTEARSPLLWSKRDLAERLEVPVTRIEQYHADGRIPLGVKVAGCRRWPTAEIEKWIEDGRPKPGARLTLPESLCFGRRLRDNQPLA